MSVPVLGIYTWLFNVYPRRVRDSYASIVQVYRQRLNWRRIIARIVSARHAWRLRTRRACSASITLYTRWLNVGTSQLCWYFIALCSMRNCQRGVGVSDLEIIKSSLNPFDLHFPHRAPISDYWTDMTTRSSNLIIFFFYRSILMSAQKLWLRGGFLHRSFSQFVRTLWSR